VDQHQAVTHKVVILVTIIKATLHLALAVPADTLVDIGVVTVALEL
jgi:hypothetical protein